MKDLKRYIMRNWFWIAIGLVLTRKAVEIAYLERGFKTVGGEWLVLPFILILVELVRDMFWGIAEVMQDED